MTEQITAAIDAHLPSAGAACLIKGEHSCMSMRGVRIQGAQMITTSLTGLFREDPDARAEFLSYARS
jgi:GTP cyclohydrolase I